MQHGHSYIELVNQTKNHEVHNLFKYTRKHNLFSKVVVTQSNSNINQPNYKEKHQQDKSFLNLYKHDGTIIILLF